MSDKPRDEDDDRPTAPPRRGSLNSGPAARISGPRAPLSRTDAADDSDGPDEEGAKVAERPSAGRSAVAPPESRTGSRPALKPAAPEHTPSKSRPALAPATSPTGSRPALKPENTPSASRRALSVFTPAVAPPAAERKTGGRPALTPENTPSASRRALQPASTPSGNRPALTPAAEAKTGGRPALKPENTPSASRRALQPASTPSGSRAALPAASAERKTGGRAALPRPPDAPDEPTDPWAPVHQEPRTTSSPSNPAPITGRMLALRLGTIEDAKHASQVLDQSEYDDSEVTQFDGWLGEEGRPKPESEDDFAQTSANTPQFDGKTPASAVTDRDALKAVEAPLQNRAGRRSPRTYAQVIDQFAVETNPRYDADGDGRPRAQIFVWDVTRAMQCEIPKFIGGREQTLGLFIDWLRLEGPSRGWRKVNEQFALESANRGMPVIAVPKDFKLKLIGVVRPGDVNPDGHPAISAAGVTRGNALTLRQAFGVDAVEYFEHD